MGVFVNERLFLRMRGSVPMLARGLVYVVWTYTWEYSTGRVLDFFNARPWDYTELQYNIHGLIALEFAPLWYCACLVSEQLLISQILTLSWGVKDKPAKVKVAPSPQREERNGWIQSGEKSNGWKGNGGKADGGKAGAKMGKRRNGQTGGGRQNGAKGH